MAEGKSKHVPIFVDIETHQSMKQYCALFGCPINHVAAEAISDWMSTVGRARMESMAKLSGKAILGKKVMKAAQPEPPAEPLKSGMPEIPSCSSDTPVHAA